MKNRYEALLVLNAQGKEDTIKEIVDRLEDEFKKEGAEVEQVQKMDKRQFAYVAGPLDAGFYVNFVFHADPQLITKLRSKFKLDPEVYRQHYQRLRDKKVKKERNKVILLGNLTRDPEVRYTPKGSAVCDLGLAVNRNYTLENGEKREEVTFVDVVLWARLAEIAGEYLKKGRPVFIEGRLQMDSWDDKQTGQKRTKIRVVGETMQLLGSRPAGGGGDSPEGERPPRPAGKPAAAAPAAPDDDEIPF
jgi:ribosomal protein S6